MARSFLGVRSPAVYTLENVSDDAAALLNRATPARVGRWMGAVIAQIFAARFPERA